MCAISCFMHRNTPFRSTANVLIESGLFHLNEHYRRRQNTGVVERAMQSAVSLDCCRDEIFHIALVADISLHKNHFTAVAFDRLDCFVSRRINIADHNLRAALRKQHRGRATNASTPARDERDFP